MQNALEAFMTMREFRDGQRAQQQQQGQQNALMQAMQLADAGSADKAMHFGAQAGPEGYAQIRDQIAGMSQAEREREQEIYREVGRVANGLRGVEVSQRSTALQAAAPGLMRLGVPPEELAQYDALLSDPQSSDAVLEALSSRVLEAQGVFDAYAPQMQAENEVLTRYQGGELVHGPVNPNATANQRLESRSLGISQQNADSTRMNAQTTRDREAREAQGQQGPDYGAMNDLRGDAERLIGSFRDIEEAYSRIVASAQQPSAAGDLALIFNYMKMLDPGSTVREGEFANAQNAGGAGARVVSAYNNLLNGQRLTQDQRVDFLSRAQSLYQAQRTAAEQRVAPFAEQAQERGFNPRYSVPQFADAPQAIPGAGVGASEPTIDDLVNLYAGEGD